MLDRMLWSVPLSVIGLVLLLGVVVYVGALEWAKTCARRYCDIDAAAKIHPSRWGGEGFIPPRPGQSWALTDYPLDHGYGIGRRLAAPVVTIIDRPEPQPKPYDWTKE